MNRLLLGDSLKWLRDRNVFPDAGVDLVYLNPPFSSNANCSVLFGESVEGDRYKTKLYQREYPEIQILTVKGLLSGTERLEAPPQANPFAKAEREGKAEKEEEML